METAANGCPFDCGFRGKDHYELLYHIETRHYERNDDGGENDEISPFVVTDSVEASSSTQPAGTPHSTRSASPVRPPSSTTYVDCPHKCGERVLSTEVQAHADFHLAEDMALEDSGLVAAVELSADVGGEETAVKTVSDTFNTRIPSSIRNYGQLTTTTTTSKSRNHAKRRTSSLKELFFGSPARRRVSPQQSASKSGRIKRLGTAELGPYAHEKRMPTWLQHMLEEGAKVTIYNKLGPDGALIRVEDIANETPDLVPVLAKLSVVDRTVARAFYCSRDVRHVAKMAKEGGFCGYRNIQMLVSYIQEAKTIGFENFPGRLPSILRLQDMIEAAWDKGFNSSGKIETGGIKLTRKYIGTPEAQALFLSLGIQCEAVAYSSHGEQEAYVTLLSAVCDYFEDDETRQDDSKVFITDKPPIYFQHQGHSMTIVGVEVHKNGAANLVVFDPMFNPSPSLKKLVGANTFRSSDPARLLKAHRRGESYLSKYRDFELLKIPPAQFS